MRQAGDVFTVEIFPVPKRRGRPPSGAAKSGAQRVADAKRRRDEEAERLRSEVEALRAEVGRLRPANEALIEEVRRLSDPKARVVLSVAGPLAAFFDEVGIPHGLAGEGGA